MELEEFPSYDVRSLRRPQSMCDVGRECSAVYHIYGNDIVKRGNLLIIEENVVVYAAGNQVIFENIISGTRQCLRGVEDDGIGCIAVHPSKKFFAVGANGCQPKIYIYSYPDLHVVKTLAGGAERGYASLSFNQKGDKLASVATSPDFMLTIWSWKEEKMGLHSKAFGQDVTCVKFSWDDENRLTTCGTGHIRFWKMASTFTGLKLQGLIGKFGKVELSDIHAFVELPDGKVISGTESGSLLLWEGHFIKCRFVQATGLSCHRGEITYVEFDRVERTIITAGTDGYVRWWDFESLDSAEVDSDHSINFEIMPLAEYFLGDGYGIKTLVDSGPHSPSKRYWVIQDNQGQLKSVIFPWENFGKSLVTTVQRMTEQALKSSTVLSASTSTPSTLMLPSTSFLPVHTLHASHAKAIVSVDTSPCLLLAASISLDGQVRIWDLVHRLSVATYSFPMGGSCIRWLPRNVDHTGTSLLIGFQDGTFRLLALDSYGLEQLMHVHEEELGLEMAALEASSSSTSTPQASKAICFAKLFSSSSWKVLMVSKPHSSAVVDFSFSHSGHFLATSGKDGTLFFFDCRRFVSMDSLYGNNRIQRVDEDNGNDSGNGSTSNNSTIGTVSSSWIPLRFLSWSKVVPPQPKIGTIFATKVTWSTCNDDKIMCTCNDQHVREVVVTSLTNDEAAANLAEDFLSYEIELPVTSVNIQIPVEVSQSSTNNAKPSAAAAAASSSASAGNGEGNDEQSKGEESLSTASATTETEPCEVRQAYYIPRIEADPHSGSANGTTSTNLCNNSDYLLSVSVVQGKTTLYHTSRSYLPTTSSIPGTTSLPLGTRLDWGPYGSREAKDTISPPSLKAPGIECLRYSWSHRLALIGSQDGSVTFFLTHPMENSSSIAFSSPRPVFGRMVAHNWQAGGAKDVCTSFDDQFLLSVGPDGLLVVHQLRLDALWDPSTLQWAYGVENALLAAQNASSSSSLSSSTLDRWKKVDTQLPEPGYLSVMTFPSPEEACTISSSANSSSSSIASLFLERILLPDFPLLAKECLAILNEQPLALSGSGAGGCLPAVIGGGSNGNYGGNMGNATVGTWVEEGDLAWNSRYSIEQAKQKTEEDTKLSSADLLKDRIRGQVKTLRKEFQEICKLNETFPVEVRVPQERLDVDTDFWKILQEEGRQAMEEVHKECAFANEKAMILRKKVTETFLPGLLIDGMKLAAFDYPSKVDSSINGGGNSSTTSTATTTTTAAAAAITTSTSTTTTGSNPSSNAPANTVVGIPFVRSLRTRGIDMSVSQMLESVRSMVKEEQLEESQNLANEVAQRKARMAVDEMKDRLQKKEDAAAANSSSNSDTHSMISSTLGGGANTGNLRSTSSVVRRELRKKRKEKLKKHEGEKPREDEDDVRDLAAIETAERTLGNYKMKSSEDYVVSSDQRVNALKKKQQMAMLEDTMVSLRLQFNEKFLGLRELKRQMVVAIRRFNTRIRWIDKELNQPLRSRNLWEPMLDASEFPDDRDEVTQEELKIYHQMRQSHGWESVVPPPASLITGVKSWVVKDGLSGSYLTIQRENLSLEKMKLENIVSEYERINTRDASTIPPYVYSATIVVTASISGGESSSANNANGSGSGSGSGSGGSKNNRNSNENRFAAISVPPLPSITNEAQSSNRPYYEVDDSVLRKYHNECEGESKANNSNEMVMNCNRYSTQAKTSTSQSSYKLLEKVHPVLRGIKAAKRHRMEISRPTDYVKEICQERRHALEFERAMILHEIETSVTAFAEAVEELRLERHGLLCDLKLAELKLMTLYREYNLLLTFEGRDNQLQQKQLRCQGEKTEISNQMNDSKSKLEGKVEELKTWQEKAATLLSELKILLPDNHPFAEPLTKIYKKKIKRNKTNGGDDEDEEEEDEEDMEDEDEDEEEIEDACPNGCEPNLYEKVIDLREKRASIDEASADIQKSIDDLKKGLERLKQREKQIVKDAVQAESEVQQFQLQKQAALNQIGVYVPLKFSQIYCFEGSGILTGPTDRPRPIDLPENTELIQQGNTLKSWEQRKLLSHIDMSTHVLFSQKALSRLDDRIHELHKESDDANVDFKELHKQRVQLKKEKESRQADIDALMKKCNDLQMLKFGRIMDLDELEAGADHSKEEEAEATIREIESKSQSQQQKSVKEVDKLKEELSKITMKNTELLKEVADLTEKKIMLDRELNDAKPSVGQDTVTEGSKEKEERERVMTYIRLQAREIETLRAEIAMLKRKDAPPIAIPSLPLPPGTQPQMSESFLPPIPSKRVPQ